MARKSGSKDGDDTTTSDAPVADFGSKPVVEHKPAKMPAAVDAPKPQAVSDPDKEVTRDLPSVPFRTFKTVSGIRKEHLAGFANYVGRHKLGPMTIPQWRAAYQDFLKSPVK